MMMGKVSCARDKRDCQSCRSNDDGFCTFLERDVDSIVKQWKSARKSRAKRKLKLNEEFFTEETIGKIIECANIIQNSELKSKKQIDAMNEINDVFYHWKSISTEDLFD